MDVLILSSSYGAGHNAVSSAVAAAINEAHPSVGVDIRDYFDFVSPQFNAVVRFTYIKSVRHTPALWGAFYDKLGEVDRESAVQRTLNKLGRRDLLNFLSFHKPGVIVCTYPVQAGVLSTLRAEGKVMIPNMTVITDYVAHNQWIHPNVDLYAVPTDQVRDGLLERGIPSDRIAVTGLPVHPRFSRPAGKEALARKFGLDPTIPTVLVMSGAFPMLGGVYDAVKACLAIKRPVQVILCCGHNKKLYADVKDDFGRDKRLKLFGFVDFVQELMEASDLVVSKAGGITVSEALVKGVPMVVYKPIPGQEAANTEYLQRHGAGESVESAEELGAVVDRLIGEAQLGKMGIAAGMLGRPQAAADTAAHAIRLMNSHRQPTSLATV